jgi:hypothetical protein
MATTYKSSQVLGTAGTTTYATLYNVPSATSAVISSIVICNRSTATKAFRIGLDTTAGTPATSEFLVYDATIDGNDTVSLTLGIALAAGMYIRVSSTDDNLTFTAFVSEIT